MAVVVPAPGLPVTTDAPAATSPSTTKRVTFKRLTKEELLKTHQAYLKTQDNSPDAPRPVKQPILSEAYPASTKSIRELEIVSR
jgi:hypothetical protein